MNTCEEIWDALAAECSHARAKAQEYRRQMKSPLEKSQIKEIFQFYQKYSQCDEDGTLRLKLLRRMSDIDVVDIIEEKTKYCSTKITNEIAKRLSPTERSPL